MAIELQGATAKATDFEELRTGFGGGLLESSDYDDARRIWNVQVLKMSLRRDITPRGSPR
jgi:hypothetical protein